MTDGPPEAHATVARDYRCPGCTIVHRMVGRIIGDDYLVYIEHQVGCPWWAALRADIIDDGKRLEVFELVGPDDIPVHHHDVDSPVVIVDYRGEADAR